VHHHLDADLRVASLREVLGVLRPAAARGELAGPLIAQVGGSAY